MAENTAMLTARLPKEIKKAGNEMIENCGYTPSQAVQVIWEYFAHCTQAEAERALKMLEGTLDEELERKRVALEKLQSSRLSQSHLADLAGVQANEITLAYCTDEELDDVRYERLMGDRDADDNEVGTGRVKISIDDCEKGAA